MPLYSALSGLRSTTFISTEDDVGVFNGEEVVRLGKQLQEWAKEIQVGSARVRKVSFFSKRPSRYAAPHLDNLELLINNTYLPSMAEIFAVFPWLDPSSTIPPFPDPVAARPHSPFPAEFEDSHFFSSFVGFLVVEYGGCYHLAGVRI